MTTVAWVSGSPLHVSDVDELETTLRAGPVSATLPREGTREARQLRRWLVQVLVAERLVAEEARARGLSPSDAPPLAELAPDRSALLALGSVAADLLTRNPLARAVFVAVTADVEVGVEEVERYYRANPEAFRVPEERIIRVPGARPVRVVGDAAGPARRSLREQSFEVVEVRAARTRALAEVSGEIAARLRAAGRRRAFTAWLDGHAAARVRLAPGFEHPGDPRQPDNTHRH